MSDNTNIPQEAITQDSVDITDSATIAMPSEAPEASGNVVTQLSVKDDNYDAIRLENYIKHSNVKNSL